MSDVKLNDTSKGILGDAHKKVGSFKESTGGGTPLAKGEKLEDHPEAHRVSQPRDEEGKFTYNSVNGKELKYGPSRGTTVPPFLRGIKLTFCQPGTKLKIEGEDGIKIKLMTIDMTADEIVEACKEYIAEEGGFKRMGEGSSITKTGKMSKAEKEAAAGIIGYKDPETLSESTREKMAKARETYEGKKSKVSTPIKKEETPAVLAESKKETPSVEKTPVSPSGSEIKSDSDEGKDKKILESMGLKDEPVKEEDVSFNSEETSDPKAFYSKHKDTIDSMVKEFNDKFSDKKITAAHVIQSIRAGKLKSLSQWKKMIGK